MPDLYLFRTTLKDMLRPRRLAMALLLVALPAAIALVWRLAAHGRGYDPTVVYNTVGAGITFGFTLVLLSAIFGTGIVSQEMEQKTMVYLLTRPVPRWRILLAKFVAALVVIIATAWLSAAALALVAFGLSGLAAGVFQRDLYILPVGAVAYGALFMFGATLLARPLLWGLLYTFGWEAWVPNLPGSFRKASLMAYLRVLAPHPAPKASSVDLASILASLNPTVITERQAWWVLGVASAVFLFGALFLFSRREYVPRDDED